MSLDRRPEGADDATVAAVGKLSEALEWIERARGRLYDFHQMSGRADLLAGEAVQMLRDAGHEELADHVDGELVGRNVIEGRWTFQVVEDYDAHYWSAARAVEARVRDALLEGARHVFEAEMKSRRRTRGHPDHSAEPPSRPA